MKKLIFFILLISCGFSSFAQTTQKIGYVDTQIILAQLPEAIKAQSDLDALVSQWTKSRDSMTTALQTAYSDYQKQQATMAPDKQREAQQTLVQQQQKIQDFEQQKFGQQNGEIYKKQEELLNPVRQKVYAAIDKVAQEEGLHFIFDKAGDVILLFADPSFDMTYKVLDKLKRNK
ncbi:MAG: molecular chaperone Skp [Ignavibacteria bacterium RBG_13_36_8]|nr:MAG: molecular chaperone Skp [Ignavibacteria bacterium RBG_13_36_8]